MNEIIALAEKLGWKVLGKWESAWKVEVTFRTPAGEEIEIGVLRK